MICQPTSLCLFLIILNKLLVLRTTRNTRFMTALSIFRPIKTHLELERSSPTLCWVIREKRRWVTNQKKKKHKRKKHKRKKILSNHITPTLRNTSPSFIRTCLCSSKINCLFFAPNKSKNNQPFLNCFPFILTDWAKSFFDCPGTSTHHSSNFRDSARFLLLLFECFVKIFQLGRVGEDSNLILKTSTTFIFKMMEWKCKKTQLMTQKITFGDKESNQRQFEVELHHRGSMTNDGACCANLFPFRCSWTKKKTKDRVQKNEGFGKQAPPCQNWNKTDFFYFGQSKPLIKENSNKCEDVLCQNKSKCFLCSTTNARKIHSFLFSLMIGWSFELLEFFLLGEQLSWSRNILTNDQTNIKEWIFLAFVIGLKTHFLSFWHKILTLHSVNSIPFFVWPNFLVCENAGDLQEFQEIFPKALSSNQKNIEQQPASETNTIHSFFFGIIAKKQQKTNCEFYLDLHCCGDLFLQ